MTRSDTKKTCRTYKTPLIETVFGNILPLYNRLSTDSRLKMSSLRKNQNANEALHSLIWSKCPKTTFLGKRRLEAPIGEGICMYDEGYLMTISNLVQTAGTSPESNTSNHAE